MDNAEPGRIVTLNVDKCLVGLAFSNVLGVQFIRAVLLGDSPPMLRALGNETFSAISTLDAQLLFVLQSVHIVSQSVWDELNRQASPS